MRQPETAADFSVKPFLVPAGAMIALLFLLLLLVTRVSFFWTLAVAAMLALLSAVALGGTAAFFGIRRRSLAPALIPFAQWGIAALYPLSMIARKGVGLDKDTVRRSFISLHNQLTDLNTKRVEPQEVLVLLPHCLQWDQCPHRITTDVRNCRFCGGCRIGELIELQNKYGFSMAVATGGTLARKIIRDTKPKVVIGVACERDLAAGIQDVKSLHVVGVLNQRPHGPCFNTTVDIGALEQALQSVIK